MFAKPTIKKIEIAPKRLLPPMFYKSDKRGAYLSMPFFLSLLLGLHLAFGLYSCGYVLAATTSTGSNQINSAQLSSPQLRANAPATSSKKLRELEKSVFFKEIQEKARLLAEGPFHNPEGQVPSALLALNLEQWNSISIKKEHTIWRKQGLNFEAIPVHPGFIFDRTVALNTLENGKPKKVVFSRSMFNYDADISAFKKVPKNFGFAGFKLLFSAAPYEVKHEIASFLGATYFRAQGKNARYGLSARGLAINTALPTGEEFPYFKEFWLLRPDVGERPLIMYALLDSPSLTGAYCFTINSGSSVIMDVDAMLFARKGATTPQKIGLAPMNSMYFYSEADSSGQTDYRPELHNSDGLLIQNRKSQAGTWQWRPLTNPSRLSVVAFPVKNPSGFGLLQRDAAFEHYQDLQARYDLRSSLWVEPKGEWGEGEIQLVEIPTKDEKHSNVFAFWVPGKLDNTRAELTDSDDEFDAAADSAKDAYVSDTAAGANSWQRSFAYRLYWMPPGLSPHSLGRAVATRVMRSAQTENIRFIIDFESASLNALPDDTGLTSFITLPEQAQLLEKNLMKNQASGGWRLDFTVRLPKQDGVVQSIISAREGTTRQRFTALLKKGENLPDPLTETWMYDLP